MKCALDKSGKRVYADDALTTEDYYCPICHKKLLQKRGMIKAFHFAHYADTDCIDHWHYDMSLWHYTWQDRFPKECQEIVKTYKDKTHRADVLLEEVKTVIEFQHSEISIFEFNDRNSFYNKLGYRVIWVFDMIEEFTENNIALIDEESKEKFYYHHAKKIFSDFDYKSDNVTLFFQIKPVKSLKLLKVTWVSPKGFYRFCGKEFSLNEFISFVKKEKIKIVYKKNSIPYHLNNNPEVPIIVRNKNTRAEYLISKDALVKYDKYHFIYGKTSNSFGEYKGKSIPLYDAFEPVWVVIWKPKKK